MEMEVDRLSNLPDHIIEHILLRMSIKDAVRTSVLSSKWRHKWATLPNLVFDDNALAVSYSEIVNIIDHVLLLHFGPIQIFKLVRKEPLPFGNVDRWILYLSRTTVQEFYLGMSNINLGYTVPSCLFSFQSLTRLWLRRSLLRLPSAFRGFVNLKSLYLMSMRLTQSACEKLISSCPVLERLTLWNIFEIFNLNIDAPSLRLFRIGCNFMDVTFSNTPSLTSVSICGWSRGNSMILLENIANIPHILKLDLNTNFIQCLITSGSLSPKAPPRFSNLQILSVDIDFTLTENVSRTIHVLQGTPNLQELNIVSSGGSETDDTAGIWEPADGLGSFVQLRHVKATHILGLPSETDFIKYVLLSSPALERMDIEFNDCNNKWGFVKELLCFKRASANAQIILLDP